MSATQKPATSQPAQPATSHSDAIRAELRALLGLDALSSELGHQAADLLAEVDAATEAQRIATAARDAATAQLYAIMPERVRFMFAPATDASEQPAELAPELLSDAELSARHVRAWGELGRNLARIDAMRAEMIATFERNAPPRVKALWDASAAAGMLGSDEETARYLRNRDAELSAALLDTADSIAGQQLEQAAEHVAGRPSTMPSGDLADLLGVMLDTAERVAQNAGDVPAKDALSAAEGLLVAMGVADLYGRVQAGRGAGLLNAGMILRETAAPGWAELGMLLQADALARTPGLGDALLCAVAEQLRAALLASPAE